MADKTTLQFNKTTEEVMAARRERELNAKQAEARAQMDRLKAPRQPLGGARPVSIPPLDAEPVEGGGSMHQQAQVLRDPTSPLSPAYSPELALMQKKGEGPFAVLPPEAQEQPGFIRGVGAMYVGNQPNLKKDTGEYKPIMSDKTRDSIAALAAFQAQAEEQQARSAVETPADKKKVAEVEDMGRVAEQTGDDLFKELRDIVGDSQFNMLANPKRRKAIEDRLAKMDLTDVILYGEVRQDVPVVPDKLVVTYRSVAAEEDLEVKRLMFGESGGDRYLMDKYTIMQLTLALVSINNEELPSHLDEKKKFNEEKFLNKFEKVIRFPIQFIADLGIQYLWFDQRVRALFLGSTEELKNT